MSLIARNATMFRSDRPINDETIARYAPSIFAVEPHERMSEKYTEIPTINVLNGLRKEGFQPFMVAQTRTRDASRREFTKHMMRLRRPEDTAQQGEANEIILINSHDGSSSYQLTAGVLRFVCMNGLICGDNIQTQKVRHSGDVVGRVIEGAYSIVDEFERVDASKGLMRSILLKEPQQLAFARAALSLKYDVDNTHSAPISASQLLQPRRFEDRNNDLWTTFNRVQENLVQGGLRGHSESGRRIRTRGITGVNSDLKLNKALWTLADEMAKLAA